MASGYKIFLVALSLSLIVILATTTLTLQLILDTRKTALVSKAKERSRADRVKSKENGNKTSDRNKSKKNKSSPSSRSRLNVKASEVNQFLKAYKRTAPHSSSATTASDARLGLALLHARTSPYVTANRFRNKDDSDRNSIPYSPSTNYRFFISKLKRTRAARQYHQDAGNNGGSHIRAIHTMVSKVLVPIRDYILKSNNIWDDNMSSNGNGGDDDVEDATESSSTHTPSPVPSPTSTSFQHLEAAAELGNPEAQAILAQIYASGIPWETIISNDRDPTNIITDDTNDALQKLIVPADFAEGGSQLAKALILWHFAAIGGNQEAQMALGFRYSRHAGGALGFESSCDMALAYYEEAAHAAMDESEMSPLKGKILPAMDRHRLSEIHMHGGASSSLSIHNRPDELEEALEYYRMRANNGGDPHAALTLANMHSYGLRGVVQDQTLAHKYYKLAADDGIREACGHVGEMYLLGQGVQQDIGEAYKYCIRGAPHDVACEGHCDPTALNCLGQIYLHGIPFLVVRDYDRAQRLFQKAKSSGSTDAIYNLAMMKLRWMSNKEEDDKLDVTSKTRKKLKITSSDPESTNMIATAAYLSFVSPEEESDTVKEGVKKVLKEEDLKSAFQLFNEAAKKGHLQSIHRAAMMAGRGIGTERNCKMAVDYFAQIAEASPAMARRSRAAYKEYMSGNYDQALRHYLVSAEAGVELSQSNAGFLFERGNCLGLNSTECASASLRMWKAAALQGNDKASLKVGDFHYYGKHNGIALRKNRSYFVLAKKWIIQLARMTFFGGKRTEPKRAVCDENDNACDASSMYGDSLSEIQSSTQADYETAATYYRKAADMSNSQANFNLGYMHEWGIGLKQDFPLAKRHYDLAGHSSEAAVPVQIALSAMKVHQRWVKLTMTNKTGVFSPRGMQILSKHFARADTALIVCLFVLLFILIRVRRRRNNNAQR
mmetsp:Transcript_15481/g.24039  ORF Transcript_15481/g.24039 Transcript_15481/m.24039 type:complete len:948 (+) Transcript_15481:99-2942(+)